MKLPNRNKARKEERRITAAQRQAEHAVLTPEQKLTKLDERHGKGLGAARERRRLEVQLKTGNKAVAADTVAQVFGTEGKKNRRGSKTSQKQ